MFKLSNELNEDEMIWIFISEDGNTVIPFKGPEQEAYDYWDIIAERGMRIRRLDHVMIQTKDQDSFPPIPQY